MTTTIKMALVVCAFLFAYSSVYAQCSDAGACSISHQPGGPGHRVGLSYTYGASGQPDDLRFHTARISADFTVLEGSRASLELPYSRQSGPLGTTHGIGDAIAIWHQRIYRQDESELTAHLGLKLALGNVNSGNLPQAYQSSLGTNDILLGLTYSYEAWTASIVYQLSRGRSENAVASLQRGDDLLLRSGYGFSAGEVDLLFELLAIKRLEESSVQSDISPATAFVTVPQSDQFQLNLQGSAVYPLTEQYSLELRAAIPFLSRDVNIDGLKRSFTFSWGISYRF